MRVFLLVGVLSLFGIFAYQWFRRSRWRVRAKNKNDLVVHRVGHRKLFHQLLMDTHEYGVPRIADIVVSDLESGQKGKRVVGAFVFITKSTLQRNKDLIKRKIVTRDAKMRQKVFIPGRKQTWNNKVVVQGTTYNLWHATHLIPFRYCLSDGDVDHLLFMGTAHLNMGAKYDVGYAPPVRGTVDSNQARVKQLKEQVDKAKNGLKLVYPTVYGSALKRYGFVQYSLDDFERLADYIINSHKDDHFKYGVECFYENGSVIPSEVQVVMINLTQHKLVFSVRLKNVF